jgi:hypothetical protein
VSRGDETNELLDTSTATSQQVNVKPPSAADPAGDWRHRVHAEAEAPIQRASGRR